MKFTGSCKQQKIFVINARKLLWGKVIFHQHFSKVISFYIFSKVRRISFVDCIRFCTCLAYVETWSWAKKFAKSLKLCIWGGNIQMIWDLGMSYNSKLWCYGFGGINCFGTLQVLTPFKICSEFWSLHLYQVAWYKVWSHIFLQNHQLPLTFV